MKSLNVYVAGKVSPESSMGTSFWRDEFCKELERLTNIRIINLDPLTDTGAFDPKLIFGRNSYLIKSADLVIVNLTDDISVGGSQEMLIAKHFGKPLLGIAKKEGKFVKAAHNIFGKEILDYTDPYVSVVCDSVVNDMIQAAEWIKNFEKITPKTLDVIDNSVKYFEKNQGKF